MSPIPKPDSLTKGRAAPQKMGGDFAPVVRFKKPGEKMIGIYQGRGTFKTPDGKDAVSHNFKLSALSEGAYLERSKSEIPLAEVELNMLVSTSGHVLDANLTDALIGKSIAVIFVAERPTKRNGSPVKVFELEVYDDVLAAA